MSIVSAKQTPRNSYTATSSQTVFAIGFEFFNTGDIKVYRNGTLLTYSASPTLVTQYSVSGTEAPGDDAYEFGSGGSITLGSGATAGDIIVIIRDISIERLTDFVPNASFSVADLNTQLDQLTAMVADLDQQSQRSVKLLDTDTIAATVTLPAKATRASKVATFDSSGNLETTIEAVDVTTIAGIAADVSTVAGISANVTIVAGISANVTTVAGISGNVTTVAGISSDVTTVAGISSNVTTVAGIQANVTTIAGISSDVTSVAGVSADVTTVAGEISPTNNISTVAGLNTEIAALGAISSDITTVSGISSNVTTVAGISANVTTVAGISSNVSTVAGISSDVTTVAGISSDITTVSGISANVTTVANNVTGVNSFAERYRVDSSDPTTSLDEGDLVYNTTDNALKYYNGSAWQSIASGLTDVVNDTTPQLGGNLDTQSFTVDGRDVSTDGTKLDTIETNADVTDAANVTAAGALMDSEVTNLAQVKAFDSSDYATAAQGSTADSALQNLVEDTSPQLGGNLFVNGHEIRSAGNGNITIAPNGSGKVILDGLSHPTADGSAGQFLKTDGLATLSFATVTQATGNELENVSEDSTPQLGGNLDVNGNSIVSASNGDIAITPNGTGDVIIDGLKHPQADGTSGQFLKTDGAGQLSFGNAGGGTVVQIVSASDATTYALTTTSATNDQPGSIAYSITPTSSSNDVVIHFTIPQVKHTLYGGLRMRVYRQIGGGGYSHVTGLSGTASGNRQASVFGNYDLNGDGNRSATTMTGTLVDSPATTSQVDYKFYFGTGDGAASVYVNRTQNDNDNAYTHRTRTHCTLMEIE